MSRSGKDTSPSKKKSTANDKENLALHEIGNSEQTKHNSNAQQIKDQASNQIISSPCSTSQEYHPIIPQQSSNLSSTISKSYQLFSNTVKLDNNLDLQSQRKYNQQLISSNDRSPHYLTYTQDTIQKTGVDTRFKTLSNSLVISQQLSGITKDISPIVAAYILQQQAHANQKINITDNQAFLNPHNQTSSLETQQQQDLYTSSHQIQALQNQEYQMQGQRAPLNTSFNHNTLFSNIPNENYPYMSRIDGFTENFYNENSTKRGIKNHAVPEVAHYDLQTLPFPVPKLMLKDRITIPSKPSLKDENSNKIQYQRLDDNIGDLCQQHLRCHVDVDKCFTKTEQRKSVASEEIEKESKDRNNEFMKDYKKVDRGYLTDSLLNESCDVTMSQNEDSKQRKRSSQHIGSEENVNLKKQRAREKNRVHSRKSRQKKRDLITNMTIVSFSTYNFS